MGVLHIDGGRASLRVSTCDSGGMFDRMADALFAPSLLAPAGPSHLPSDVRVLCASSLRERGMDGIDRLVAGIPYHTSLLVRDALHAFKYHHMRAMAQPLASIAAQGLPSLLPHPDAVLCPVPLHWARHALRGFNQAEEIARVLSDGRLPLRRLLRRRHATGHQVGRNAMERRHALRAAFAPRGAVPRHVILVDDVVTTGATLSACATALRAAGATMVQAIVVALAA